MQGKEGVQMPEKKYRLWFVQESIPRTGNYKRRISFENAEKISDEERNSIRVYFGEYDIGVLHRVYDSSYMFVGSNVSMVHYLTVYLYNFYDRAPYTCVELTRDEVLRLEAEGATLEEFFKMLFEKNNVGKIELELVSTPEELYQHIIDGYRPLTYLNDILHEDARKDPKAMENYKDDRRIIMLRWRTTEELNATKQSSESFTMDSNDTEMLKSLKHHLWFVPEVAAKKYDYRERLNVKNFEELLREFCKNDDMRMYIGYHEIGTIGVTIESLTSGFKYPAYVKGKPIFNLYGALTANTDARGLLSVDEFEKLLANESLAIEDVLYKVLHDNGIGISITDSPAVMFELVHSGWKVITPIRELLHPDVWNSTEVAKRSKQDKRVLFVKA